MEDGKMKETVMELTPTFKKFNLNGRWKDEGDSDGTDPYIQEV